MLLSSFTLLKIYDSGRHHLDILTPSLLFLIRHLYQNEALIFDKKTKLTSRLEGENRLLESSYAAKPTGYLVRIYGDQYVVISHL